MPGSMRTSGASSTPAAPASMTPMTKVCDARRRVSMPSACASTGLPVIARTRRPIALRRYHSTSAIMSSTASAISARR